MEVRQVTVAGTTHKKEPLFIVMSTQNPIEQEGTYPLPEAQMDRFLMHVMIDYPPVLDEVEVIRLVRSGEKADHGRQSLARRLQKSRKAVFSTPVGRSANSKFRRRWNAIWPI